MGTGLPQLQAVGNACTQTHTCMAIEHDREEHNGVAEQDAQDALVPSHACDGFSLYEVRKAENAIVIKSMAFTLRSFAPLTNRHQRGGKVICGNRDDEGDPEESEVG